MHSLLQNPIAVNVIKATGMGALTGVGGALLVDYKNFQKWQTWHDATTYNWSVAILHWMQGAIGGAVMGAGAILGWTALVG